MDTLVLDIHNIQLNYGQKEILNIERLTVYNNDRIGIIGNNGQGKTSLVRIITEELAPNSGTIQREVSFNYYAQQDDIDERYRANELDSSLLGRLKVPNNNVHRLSGGELAKYRLAQVLSVYQPGLILDEPTTHLDKKSIDYLVEELRYYYGSLLFVSHDRYFLNQLASQIWEVQDGSVSVYKGNYDAYLQQKEQARLAEQHAHENYQKEKQRLEKAVQKKHVQAQKTSKVSTKQKNRQIKPDRLSGTKQKDTVQKNLHKAAKAIEKRLEQLEKRPPLEKQPRIQFPQSKILNLHNPFPIMGEDISLQKGSKLLLDKVSFQLPLNQKIALVGDNGSGKSSLLQYILSEEEGIVLSPKARITTYQQFAYKFTQTETILDYLLAKSDYSETIIRSILTHLGFAHHDMTKSLRHLSGGEATRLALAQVFTQPSNILILDEPTNFIDIATIQALEAFIKAYPGTILFTSHDQYFVENVADSILKIDKQQLIHIR